jgi:hypothetical protein
MSFYLKELLDTLLLDISLSLPVCAPFHCWCVPTLPAGVCALPLLMGSILTSTNIKMQQLVMRYIWALA